MQEFERTFRKAYANVLEIPASDIDIRKVSCGAKLLSDSNSSNSSSITRGRTSPAAPRPTRHRALLQAPAVAPTPAFVTIAPTAPTAAAATAGAASGSIPQDIAAKAKALQAAPASVRAVFQVPAPTDPIEKQQRKNLIHYRSGQVLGPSMAILFEHPVDIDPPVLLNAPRADRQAPRAGTSRPEPEPEPSPEPAVAEEVEVEVEVETEPSPVPAANVTSPNVTTVGNVTVGTNATKPQPPTNATDEANTTVIQPPAQAGNASGVNLTAGADTTVLQSPAPAGNATGLNATSTTGPPTATNDTVPMTNGSSSPAAALNGSNVTSPVASPLPSPPPVAEVTAPIPVYMPPAPPAPVFANATKTTQQERWENAPACLTEPTGTNSIPDKQGRLWGWINGISCAFKGVSGKTAVTVSWDTAADCTGVATSSNSVFDATGRLWGWQNNRSCAFRGEQKQAPAPAGQSLVLWQDAPTCKGVPWGSNAVRGADGQLWGYEKGTSCAFRHPSANQAVTWAAAPQCVGAPHFYKPVKDSFGRLWGWENGRSCRF